MKHNLACTPIVPSQTQNSGANCHKIGTPDNVTRIEVFMDPFNGKIGKSGKMEKKSISDGSGILEKWNSGRNYRSGFDKKWEIPILNREIPLKMGISNFLSNPIDNFCQNSIFPESQIHPKSIYFPFFQISLFPPLKGSMNTSSVGRVLICVFELCLI